MLQQTFLHFHGVGPKTEQKLWEHGIRDWNQLEQAWRNRMLLERCTNNLGRGRAAEIQG